MQLISSKFQSISLSPYSIFKKNFIKRFFLEKLKNFLECFLKLLLEVLINFLSFYKISQILLKFYLQFTQAPYIYSNYPSNFFEMLPNFSEILLDPTYENFFHNSEKPSMNVSSKLHFICIYK